MVNSLPGLPSFRHYRPDLPLHNTRTPQGPSASSCKRVQLQLTSPSSKIWPIEWWAFLLSCFISGLLPEIRREVQAHQPLTLSQAAGLARLQEEKLSDLRPPPPPICPRPPSLSSPSLSRPPSLSPLLPPPPPLTCPNPPPPPFKRLTSEEIASRHERGLCFSCDEKYHRGHRCASRVFLLIAEAEDPSGSNIDPSDSPPTHPTCSTLTRPKSA